MKMDLAMTDDSSHHFSGSDNDMADFISEEEYTRMKLELSVNGGLDEVLARIGKMFEDVDIHEKIDFAMNEIVATAEEGPMIVDMPPKKSRVVFTCAVRNSPAETKQLAMSIAGVENVFWL